MIASPVDPNHYVAKALAQQLAPFRAIPAAMDPHKRPGNSNASKNTTDSDPSRSLVDPNHYVAELNSPEWQEGFAHGQRAKAAGGTSRFARLRRDAPDVADQFLAGEFVKRFKNGTVQPDLVGLLC